jgi:hypothetical protein
VLLPPLSLKLPDDPMIIQGLAAVAYASYASSLQALASSPSSGYWPSVYCLLFMAIVSLLLLLSCHAMPCYAMLYMIMVLLMLTGILSLLV